MTVTFVGANSAQGRNVHASVPVHQSGDILIAFAVNNAYFQPAPSIGSGWTLLASLNAPDAGYRGTIAYRTAVSSGTTNTGWSNFDYQTLAVYRGGKYVSLTFGVSNYYTNSNSISAGPFFRPGANTRAVFLTLWVNSGTINQTISFPYDRPISTRHASGGSSFAYYQFLGDELNESGNYNYGFYQQSAFRFAGVAVEFLDPTVYLGAETGVLAFQPTNAGFSLYRAASETSYAITGQSIRFNLSLAAGNGQVALTGGDVLFSLQLRSTAGTFSVAASNADFSANRLAQSASYALFGANAAFRFNAPVAIGSFAITAQVAELTAFKPNYGSLAGVPPTPPARTYGGSEPTLPSFLRPYYVKYNSVTKSRDLGETEILIADFAGQIGSQSGANTLFFKVTLARELDLRVVKTNANTSTDRLISVGILDSERKPIPMTPAGYGYLNDIHNTVIDESKSRLPAGIYYITVSTSQWQSLPFAFSLFVGSYALLSGNAIGRLIATGRLPLLKPVGQLLGTAPLSATVLNPDFIKNLIPRLDLGGPQAEFLTPGTYNWTAPAGVTSVSAVCIGGGGGGGNAWANTAGSGGGLGWKNNIPVSPGTTYTVVVGGGGLRNSLSAGGNSYFISLSTVAGYGGGNASSNQDTNGPNKNGYGGGWFGDGGGAGGNATNWTGGGGAGGYTGNGGNSGADGSGGGGGGGLTYSSTYGVGSGGGTGVYGQGDNGLTGRSRNGTLWSGSAVNGFGGSGGSTATGINGVTTGTGGLQGQTASYGQPYVNSITGGFPGGGGGGPGTSYGGGNGGGGAVRIMWGGDRVFPASNTADITDSEQTFAGGLASPSLTLTIMRGTALGQMLPSGRLKQTWRIAGTVTGSASLEATLSSETPYGSGYGY